jgi:hypothetical protein
MVDFSNRDGIKSWLDAIKPAKPRREVALALAARAYARRPYLAGNWPAANVRGPRFYQTLCCRPCALSPSFRTASDPERTYWREPALAEEICVLNFRASKEAGPPVLLAAEIVTHVGDAPAMTLGWASSTRSDSKRCNLHDASTLSSEPIRPKAVHDASSISPRLMPAEQRL